MRALHLLSFLALLGACKKSPDKGEEARKVVPGSTDDATKSIVDEDYRFELRWPGEGWKLLREQDARHLNEDAVAGLSSDDVNAVVIVEHAPGGTLAGFADLIIENLALENKNVTRSDTKVSGEPAVRFEATGTLNDLAVEIRGLILIHEEHAYQMLAFSPAGMASSSKIDRALEAFSLVDGPVKGRAVSLVVEDQVGVGWRVAGGVFESAVSRLRIQPPAGWRLMVGTELANANADAEVGLAATEINAYVAVITEPIAGGELATYRKQRVDASLAEMKALDPTTMKVAGREVEVARGLLESGLQFEYLIAVIGEGDRAYQVLGWYPQSVRDRAVPLLAAAFDAFEILSLDRTAELARALAAEPDRQNTIGATYSLRNGVYRDFANRLRWTMPKVGFWKVSAGQDARARNESALFSADELVSGVQSQVIVEPAGAYDADSFHRLVTEHLSGSGFSPKKQGKGTIAGAPARFTEFTFVDGGLALRYRATTALAGDLAIQVLVWGIDSAWPKDEALLEAPARALALAPDLREIEEGTVFRDHRLGFAMALPPAWRRTDITPEPMRALANLSQWRSGDSEILGLAFYAFDQKDDAWMLDLIEQVLRQENASIALSNPTTEPAQVAGREARHVTWDTAIGRIDAYLLKRDATFYGLLARDGDRSSATARTAVSAFSLLD